MLHTPFYDPEKTFDDNYKNGPFGAFADGKVIKDHGEPAYDFLGHKVYLPFGIGAGPLYNGRFVKAALDKGFDIVTHKTVRPEKYPSNKFPNILAASEIKGNLSIDKAQAGVVGTNKYYEPLNIINSFNNPSFEPGVWQKDLRSVLDYLRKGQVLICSYEAIPDSDFALFLKSWTKGARLIKETGVDLIEMNTSCPNAGKTSLLCFDVKRMKKIISEVKKEIGDTKIIVKLAYFKDKKILEDLIRATAEYVDAYSAINTIQAKIVDENKNPILMDEPRFGKAGVSGDCIRHLSIEMIKDLRSIRKKNKFDYKIIGTGGVFNASHYKLFMESGADAVTSVTGVMWNPYLAQEIKETKNR